ncbi:response regulator transcription factor [Termitidicoccus mucosus]|uniref:Two-component system response regulator n=1 Tax=Termitidicoccus mucosus TaxID=1184151 RepID=A0A178IDX1_9BACT|nr:two-component system response regulator [Opitutaceae bacterium TSB47]
MRILVVEDSPRLQTTLGIALRKSGYVVDVAGDGETGLWMAQTNDYDAIVLDLMLPKLDGMKLLAELRHQGNAVHVLLLTARDAVEDRVRGLQGGADDYLIKPFAMEELLARVQALCRRGYGSKADIIMLGALEINAQARTVRVAGRPVEITAREYLILEYLARRRGQVASRGEIEAHIYEGHADLMSNVVDSAVCMLRKKLGGGAPLIRTRRGFGYVLEEEPEDAAAQT